MRWNSYRQVSGVALEAGLALGEWRLTGEGMDRLQD